MCGCVSELCAWTVHVYSFYRYTHNMFRHWFCMTGVLNFALAKVPLYDGHKMWFPSTEKCMYSWGISKKGQCESVSWYSMQLTSSWLGNSFFFCVDFCPKFPPAQSCISIIVFYIVFILTHANIKRLASALIYYTAVIVILSLTTLADFSLLFSFHQSFLL